MRHACISLKCGQRKERKLWCKGVGGVLTNCISEVAQKPQNVLEVSN